MGGLGRLAGGLDRLDALERGGVALLERGGVAGAWVSLGVATGDAAGRAFFFASEAFSATASAASPLSRSRHRSSTSGFLFPLPTSRMPSGSTTTVYSASSTEISRFSVLSRTVVMVASRDSGEQVG